MKKFEFTLNRMLDYRQSLLEKEKNSLMQLFARRNQLEEAQEENSRQFGEKSLELRELTAAGTTIDEVQKLNYRLEALRRQAKSLLGQMEELAGQIEAQREVVLELSQQVKGLEKLRENQLEEYGYQQRKEETERVAELISAKIARATMN